MSAAPDRDALLAEYDILSAADEPDLQALAELATQICAVPNAVVNLISERWQHQVGAVWFTLFDPVSGAAGS